MRAIALKCPNCAASLNAAPAAQTVTCAYCQTTSRVRARTAFFEAPVNLPPAPPQLAHLPVATQQHSRRWTVGLSISIALFVGLMALIPWFVMTKVRQAVTGHDGLSGRTLSWISTTPLATDVNGDGIADLVGKLRGLDDINSVHLVAVDGASGKRLWRSEVLGAYQETYQGVVALLGDTLMFVNGRGLARSFSVAGGEAGWKVNLAEKLETVCRHQATFYVVTADERWIAIDTASGKAAEAREPPSCEPLPTDARDQPPANLTALDRFDRERPKPSKLDGMYIGEHLVVEGHDRLALGYKSPGTSVPMVARYRVQSYEPPAELEPAAVPADELTRRQRRELRRRQRAIERANRKAIDDATFEVMWKSQVPSRDPLGASSSRIELVGLSLESDCVVVPYEVRNQPIHVACLSYETGEHRWDVALPKAFIDRLSGLAVTPKRAFVYVSSRVHALDLASGKRLFTVGQRN